MKLAIVGGLILLVIFTMSLAQIRYAVFNPISSLDVLLGLVLEIAFISYVGYRFLARKNPQFPVVGGNYSLIGAKGGKASRKLNFNNNRKNKRTSF